MKIPPPGEFGAEQPGGGCQAHRWSGGDGGRKGPRGRHGTVAVRLRRGAQRWWWKFHIWGRQIRVVFAGGMGGEECHQARPVEWRTSDRRAERRWWRDRGLSGGRGGVGVREGTARGRRRRVGVRVRVLIGILQVGMVILRRE